jgi:transcriptional regulator with XRE-family HTH domain
MPPKPETEVAAPLGERLRQHRDAQGWSLRQVAARAEVNHGYLSLLERGEVTEPAPSMLHKLARGYDLPFIVLMRWAGYVEADEKDLTQNQAIALSYLGDDVSDDELAAVKAVLDAIRSKGAAPGFAANSLDRELTAQRTAEIRQQVMRLLNKADCLDVIPTPLDHVIEVSRLVAVGEVTLDEEERRKLQARFGALVDVALARLKGAVHFRSREIWVAPTMHELRKRFVTAHEIGHDVLPWQRDTIAYLDDEERLRPDIRIDFEREANQAAIELLSQGRALNKEADDSPLTVNGLLLLGNKFEISLQAVFRRVVEESSQTAATIIRFKGGTGRLGKSHVYTSRSFETRFGWATIGIPEEVRRAAREQLGSASVPDRTGTFAELVVDEFDTPYARLALVVPKAAKRGLFRRVG